jgi:hypothetical protein
MAYGVGAIVGGRSRSRRGSTTDDGPEIRLSGAAWTEHHLVVKHIQVIDSATNCTYSVFAAPDEDFALLFPTDTDVAFPDEIVARIGEERANAILGALWEHPVHKNAVQGIHGTLFYEMDGKKALYPTRREAGMDPRSYSAAQRKLYGLA